MRLAADAVAVALRCMQQMLQIRQLSCICTPLDVAHKLWYHFLYAPWTGHLNDPRKGSPYSVPYGQWAFICLPHFDLIIQFSPLMA